MNCLDLYDKLNELREEYSDARRNQKFYVIYIDEQKEQEEPVLTMEELRKIEDEKEKEIDNLVEFMKSIKVNYKINSKENSIDGNKKIVDDIIDDFLGMYNIKKDNVVKMIEKSMFYKLLKENPNYVYKYDSEYWTENIIIENNIQFIDGQECANAMRSLKFLFQKYKKDDEANED